MSGNLRIGSLFSGYSGLDMAAEAFFGATTAWHVEFDKAPSKILAHHYPDVPNYGDITAVDWTSVEPVDILTGGYPCQPFSLAGRRAGTDDERHLWPYVVKAIGALQPSIVVFENVRGHLSLGFDEVLRDLAWLGYDVEWCLIKASDVGAPHGRARIFMIGVRNARCIFCGNHRRRGDDRNRRPWEVLQVEDSCCDERPRAIRTEAPVGTVRRESNEGEGSLDATPRNVGVVQERQASRGGSDNTLALAEREAGVSGDRPAVDRADGGSTIEAERSDGLDARRFGEGEDPEGADCPRESTRPGSAGTGSNGSADGREVALRLMDGTRRRLVWSCGAHGEVAGEWVDEGGSLVRASDVGAPHGRFRVFVLAYRPGTGREWAGIARDGQRRPADGSLAPVSSLLPTPAAMNPNDEEDLGNWLDRRARVKESKQNGNGFGTPLGVAVRLLPTATAQDANASGGSTPANVTLTDAVTGRRGLEPGATDFGQYEPAVRRWEAITRPAPAPTLPDGRNGAHRLNAAFAEWMMGVPEGWITDPEIGLTRREQLKAAGNGVVPQQAHAALDGLWARVTEAVAA